jgi:hypothetical protein
MTYAIVLVSGGTIYVPVFMKIVKVVHTILKFYETNLRPCNVGITDGEISDVSR